MHVDDTILPPLSIPISWVAPEDDAGDEALFFLADLIAAEEGVDIDYAYRLAQLRYRTMVFLTERRGD